MRRTSLVSAGGVTIYTLLGGINGVRYLNIKGENPKRTRGRNNNNPPRWRTAFEDMNNNNHEPHLAMTIMGAILILLLWRPEDSEAQPRKRYDSTFILTVESGTVRSCEAEAQMGALTLGSSWQVKGKNASWFFSVFAHTLSAGLNRCCTLHTIYMYIS